MPDDDSAAREARKHTKTVRPIHRDRFGGSPRKLKGRTFGEWVKQDNGKWVYVPRKRDDAK